MSISFIKMSTGEPYSGAYPDPVTALVSTKGKLITGTRLVSARPGDPDYQKVLVAYMYEHGYIEVKPTKEAL